MRPAVTIAALVAFTCAVQGLLVLPAGAKSGDDTQQKRLQNSVACLYCHRQIGFEAPGPVRFDFSRYDAGAHGEIACVDCHVEFGESPHRAAGGRVMSMTMRCESCHKTQTAKYESGVHLEAGVECIECHSAHYPPRISEMNEGQLAGFVVGVCLRCHSTAQEGASSVVFNDIHARRLGAGDVRVPACNTCHGSHDTKSFTSRMYRTQKERMAVCTPCHPDIDSDVVAGYSHEPMHKSFPVVHIVIALMIGLLLFEGGQMGAFLVLDLRRHAVNMRAGMAESAKAASEESQAAVASTPDQESAPTTETTDVMDVKANGDGALQDLTEEQEDGSGGA